MIHFILHLRHCIKRILYFPGGIKKIIFLAKDENTYYPLKKRKSYIQKFWELFLWYLKYEDINYFYYLYGFDVDEGKNVEQSEYQDYQNFMYNRNIANLLDSKTNCQIVLLRDKFLFYKYMKNIIPVPEVFAVFMDGQLYDNNMQNVDIQSIGLKQDFFLKDIDGECASFVKKVHNYMELQTILEKVHVGKYILQESVSQCKELNLLNPYSISTLRIVTVRNKRDAEPYVLSSLLRVGTKATGAVDNWAAGGLAIGIQDDGFLNQVGFYKPGYGKTAEIHPDTGICFSEFQVPHFRKAAKMACQAHKLFYNICSIGWDIAITDDGPVFIEGNDNWEISLMQACDKGLKEEWMAVLKNE